MSLRYFVIQTAPEVKLIDAPSLENTLRLLQIDTEIAVRDITHVVDSFRIVHSQLEIQVAILAQQLCTAAIISSEGDRVCEECPAATDGCIENCVEHITEWAKQQAIEQVKP